ncbi:MAG: MFS transporter [Chloroflexi bacterium]|nr:MFS transporter [Chloroflexota bacterium]MBU1747501.1 MFS transporter [Chloroflexota bacterium]MBU1879688.1 MFS transporter [Chloroflexota bacterium]
MRGMFGLGRDNTLVWWSLLLWGLGGGLYVYINPLYIKSLGASPTDIGLALSIANAAMMLTYLPAGFLSDRTSRRKNLVVGWVMGVVGTLLVAVAPDWRWLIPGLVISYMSGFVMPALQSYVLAAGRTGDAKRTYTLVMAAYSIGTVPSPLIGGWIGQMWGLRAVYLVATVLYALSTVVMFLIAEQPVPAPSRTGNYRTVLRNRRFMVLCLVFTAILSVFYLGVSFAPNYLEEVVGLKIESIGALGVAAALGSSVLAIVLSSARIPRRLGVLLSQGSILTSFLLLLYAPALPFLALAFFLRGGYSSGGSLLTTWLGETLDPETMGRGFGIYNTIYSVGLTVVPYVAGWLYAGQPALPFLLAAALLVPTMLLILFLPQYQPIPKPHAPVQGGPNA